MKTLRFLRLSLLICVGTSSVAWAWPPGLRSSSSFFRGLLGGPEVKIASFGDSVASGFNSNFWLARIKGGTYADHFGRNLNEASDRSIRVRNLAWAGFRLDQILSALRKDHIGRIREADLIFLEGGGNDFLNLYREKYIDLCKPENFYPTLENAKKNFRAILDDTTANKKSSAKVRVIGMYYPLVNNTRVRACELRGEHPTVHAAFMNALAKFNWYLASESKKRGYVFVDTLAHLNCAQSNWSKCKLAGTTSEAAYRERLISIDERGILRDPWELGVTQKDHIHPNTYGHSLIAWMIETAR